MGLFFFGVEITSDLVGVLPIFAISPLRIFPACASFACGSHAS
jgi:hypothetical protein